MTVAQAPFADLGCPPYEVSDHLVAWVAGCLADGYSQPSIAAKLTALGIDEAAAERTVQRVAGDPLFAFGLRTIQQRDKLASLLDALARQLRLSKVAEGVPVESNLAAE